MADQTITFTDVLGEQETFTQSIFASDPDFSHISNSDDLKTAVDTYIKSQQQVADTIQTTNAAALNRAAQSVLTQKSQLDSEQNAVDKSVLNLQDYEEKILAQEQGLINDAGGVLFGFDNTLDNSTDQSQTKTAAPIPLIALAGYLLF